jgi:hypothetical protein
LLILESLSFSQIEGESCEFEESFGQGFEWQSRDYDSTPHMIDGHFSLPLNLAER